jgi:hypothetical protein
MEYITLGWNSACYFTPRIGDFNEEAQAEILDEFNKAAWGLAKKVGPLKPEQCQWIEHWPDHPQPPVWDKLFLATAVQKNICAYVRRILSLSRG